MMGQAGRPTYHDLLYLPYLLYPALPCLGLFCLSLEFNVEEIMYKLSILSGEP